MMTIAVLAGLGAAALAWAFIRGATRKQTPPAKRPVHVTIHGDFGSTQEALRHARAKLAELDRALEEGRAEVRHPATDSGTQKETPRKYATGGIVKSRPHPLSSESIVYHNTRALSPEEIKRHFERVHWPVFTVYHHADAPSPEEIDRRFREHALTPEEIDRRYRDHAGDDTDR